MMCPVCGRDTAVRDSRPSENNTIRRRRVCDEGHKFFTWEMTKNLVRDRQKHLEYKAKWRKDNPEKLKAQRQRDELRRSARKQAKETGVPATVIYQQWGVA